MHADGYYAIGYTHLVCQDYVRVGEHQGKPYALFSDGCSSCPDTDVGARCLVLAQDEQIRHGGTEESLGGVLAAAEGSCQSLGLDTSALYATLGVLSAEEEHVKTSLYGDGAIIGRRRDRTGLDIFWVDYSAGMPFYPYYLFSPESFKAWKETKGNAILHARFAGASTVIETELEDVCFSHRFAYDQYDLVLGTTDGLFSFKHKDNPAENVSLYTIAEQMCDVKVPTGAFMVRRCKKFLGDYCQKRGWIHLDDVSVAAIWIG